MAFRATLLVRAALAGFRRVAIGHQYDFLKTPNVVTLASRHARSDPQRFVDSRKVIMYSLDRNHRKKRLSAVLHATEYLFLENMALKLVRNAWRCAPHS